MEDKAQINAVHLGAMFVVATLSSLLYEPTVAVESGGRAAWAVAVLAGIIGYLLIHLVGRLSLRFPDQTVVGYAGRLLGRPVGKGLGLILALVLALNAGAEIRMAMKSAIGVYFLTTPTLVVALLMTLTALTASWNGIVTASRLAPLLTAGITMVFLLTFPLLWRWMQPGYLIPLRDLSPIRVQSRAFWSALSGYRMGMLLTALGPYIADRRRALTAISYGYLLGWLGTFVAVITPVLVFNPEGARALAQPFPYVIAIIRLPNFPFERVELLARLAYNVNVFYKASLLFFLSGRLGAEVFGTARIRPFMLGAAAISLVPTGWITAEQPGERAVAAIAIGTVLCLLTVYPLLWLAYAFRRRRRSRAAPGPSPGRPSGA